MLLDAAVRTGGVLAVSAARTGLRGQERREYGDAKAPAPTYAIDDRTAIKVTAGAVEVFSEGHWKLFHP